MSFTKNVLETALNEEVTEHLGHEKNRAGPDRDSSNLRNGTRPKTVLTEASGRVTIDVPRDSDGTFEPVIVKKRQRRLNGVDELVLSLYAHGLTTREIRAHFAQIYDAQVSRETVSRITDKVIEEMNDWSARPLNGVNDAIFIDAIVDKTRDGQVPSQPIHAAIGVSVEGEKDIFGLWTGTGGEGVKFWMSVVTDIKNRSVTDTFFLVSDGLKGLPEVVGNVWPLTTVRTCVIHPLRDTFKLASKKDWDAINRGIKSVYTAPSPQAARDVLDGFAEVWGKKYSAIIRLWGNALEACSGRIRHRLRRPLAGRGNLLMRTVENTVNETDPNAMSDQRGMRDGCFTYLEIVVIPYLQKITAAKPRFAS